MRVGDGLSYGRKGLVRLRLLWGAYPATTPASVLPGYPLLFSYLKSPCYRSAFHTNPEGTRLLYKTGYIQIKAIDSQKREEVWGAGFHSIEGEPTGTLVEPREFRHAKGGGCYGEDVASRGDGGLEPIAKIRLGARRVGFILTCLEGYDRGAGMLG